MVVSEGTRLSRRSRVSRLGCALVSCLIAVLLLITFTFSRHPSSPSSLSDEGRGPPFGSSSAGWSLRTSRHLKSEVGQAVLVLYLLYDSHKEEHQANFEYFRRFGMAANDGNTYLILGKQLEGEAARQLPPNAQFVQMEQQCAWGMLGQLLDAKLIDLKGFSSFIVATSFVRGPYVPPAFKGLAVSWSDALVAQLNGLTKLVSPIISCEGVRGINSQHINGNQSIVAHISWQAFAMDQVGLGLLQALPNVFKCHDPAVAEPDVYQATLASAAVLNAGFNIGSLMTRYQGVDWRNASTWECNARVWPGLEFGYDGGHLNPLEIMFVEVNEQRLRQGSTPALTAKRYDKWVTAQEMGTLSVSDNAYAMDPTPFRKEKIAYAKERGPGCFDALYYGTNNVDLKGLSSAVLWDHYVNFGQFEGRPYRFSCVDLRARGPGCFDDEFYNTENVDLHDKVVAGTGFTAAQTWDHFIHAGRSEGRHYRFKPVCGEDLDSPNTL